MNNVALITGASSGIGLEFARIHAAKGGDLVLTARRQSRLEELEAELEQQHGITVIIITKDLSLPGAAEELYLELRDKNIKVDYLINNAGFGGHGFFHERDWEKDKAMINLNIMALTALTRLILPDMILRNSGRILNVASGAGFLPGPLQAVYYATKAFVVSFSEAIASELSDTDITVTALCPGATATEFAQGADLEDSRYFKSRAASAKDVATYGYNAMLRGKVIAVPGVKLKFLMNVVLRILPRRLVTKISRAAMEKA